MKLQGYRLIFVAVGLIGLLLIASPVLSNLFHQSPAEQFSELYILGPNNTAEGYPYNIVVGENYSLYLGVGNHIGSSAYYVLYVKLANQTDLLPNVTLGTPSSLQPLYEYRFAIQDGVNWESQLAFSISSAVISGNNSQIKTIQINGATLSVNKSAIWDSNSTSFNYKLFFELWLYNDTSNTFSYNDRFVDLPLNLTRTA